MRFESSSRSFQMTVRKTCSSPDFPFRNTRRYFDSDQMLEESISLSKRKLQLEHSGGRESNVLLSKRKTETNFKLRPRQTLLAMEDIEAKHIDINFEIRSISPFGKPFSE